MQKLPPPSPDLRYAELTWTEAGEPFSPVFQDIYFSRGSGPAETQHVFLRGNRLPERWNTHDRDFFVVGELGFGTGLNFLSTWRAFGDHAPPSLRLIFFSCERSPLKPADMDRIHTAWPDLADESAALRRSLPPPVSGFHTRKFENGRITLILLYGDAHETLPLLHAGVDAWFLDGFAPSRNPEMWTTEIFHQIARHSLPGATAATYSASSHVRDGLTKAGFLVQKVAGSGRKKEMITAEKSDAGTQPGGSAGGRSVIVIGAGFAGAAAARALAERSFEVAVIDRSIAAGASGGPAAVFYPALAREPTASGRWTLLGSLFLSSQIPQTGLHVGDFALGGTAALGESSTPGLTPREVGQDRDAATMSLLAGLELSRGGFHFQRGGWIRGEAWCRTLLTHPRVRFGAGSVSHLERTESGWRVRDARGDIIAEARHVILAAGEATPQFSQTSWLPLTRIHGRLIHHPALPRPRIIVSGKATIAALHDGSVTLGSTFEKESARLSDSEAAQNILTAARTEFPIPPLQIDAGHLWSAVRAASKDYLPIVGPVPDLDAVAAMKIWPGSLPPVGALPRLPQIFVMCAFGARGLAYSTLCAELIAAQICGEPLPVESDLVDAVDPGRFVLRAIRRGEL